MIRVRTYKMIPLLIILMIMTSMVLVMPGPARAFVATGFDELTQDAGPSYYNITLGWEFIVNTPIRVTHLGYLDLSAYGYPSMIWAHEVALWSGSDIPMASATLSPSDPLIGNFRYVTLATPVTLLPDQICRIGGLTGSITDSPGPDFIAYIDITDYDNWWSDPTITVTDGYYESTQGILTFPVEHIPFPLIGYGPNFQGEVVPIPGSIFLLGSGFLGLAGWRWQKRRVNG